MVRLGFLLLLLGGSAQACAMAGLHAQARLTLYFGRDRAGLPPVSDAAWNHFAATRLTRLFPEGFTTTQGIGQWRNPQTGQITQEPSIIVDVITSSDNLPARINEAVRDYKTRFQQQSIGVVMQDVCAGF